MSEYDFIVLIVLLIGDAFQEKGYYARGILTEGKPLPLLKSDKYVFSNIHNLANILIYAIKC